MSLVVQCFSGVLFIITTINIQCALNLQLIEFPLDEFEELVGPIFNEDPQVHSSEDGAPTPELARLHGYQCETHSVQTPDGYVLGVHRLPGGRRAPLDPSLPPLILQHGLIVSSADWLFAGPNNALGYLLADQGYDVWLPNIRGNIYSRVHRTIPTSDPSFWNWTWHEMGVFDMPAVIDHVLRTTGHPKLHYVAHSMGTTMFWVMCSLMPEYNAKVELMVGLAPVAYQGNTRSPLHYLALFSYSLEKVADFLGHGEFLPRNCLLDTLFKLSCEVFKFEKKICENYLFIICGFDSSQFNDTLLPIILGHDPAGTSTKTMVHFAQGINSRKFQQFDYGEVKNMFQYNSSSPPQYDLSKVTAPVALFYGDNDLLTVPQDIHILYNQLPNRKGIFRVNLTSFNHLDFIWAKDVKSLVYDKVIDMLKHYRGKSDPFDDSSNILVQLV